jgi:PilZ domain
MPYHLIVGGGLGRRSVVNGSRRKKMKGQETDQCRTEVKGYSVRRSPRALVSIPVVIRGTDKQGYAFEEDTQTLQVSKYGALISSVHELEEGSILQLRLKRDEHWSEFRVAWISSENDTLGHVGIEFVQSTSFFGVSFLEEDWAS